jgi:thiol:disulfide interchange protein DsbA
MRIFVLLLMGVFTLPSWAASFSEGVEYKTLPLAAQTPTQAKEVRELFFYGCSHCYQFEAPLNEWLARKPAGVKFVRQPGLFDGRWAWSAAVFYTAQALNIEDKIHHAMFDAMFGKGPKPTSTEDIYQIFVRQGADYAQVKATFDSFGVRNQIENAMRLTRQYEIDGVPSLVVNGKYLTSPSMAGDAVFSVVEFLLQK